MKAYLASSRGGITVTARLLIKLMASSLAISAKAVSSTPSTQGEATIGIQATATAETSAASVNRKPPK